MIDRLPWKALLKAGNREDAAEIHEFPVRFTDIDFFDHMNNSVYSERGLRYRWIEIC